MNKLKKTLLFVALSISRIGIATTESVTTLTDDSSLETKGKGESLALNDSSINPYSSAYLFLEYSRNFPIAYAEVFFEPGNPTPAVGYRFVLSQDWYMGVGVQFRKFQRKEAQPQRMFPIFAFSQEATRLMRIHHPVYLGVGYQLLYLGPSLEATFPLKRDEEYEAEIGAALTSGIIVILKNKGFLRLFAERWRGTKTQRIQGINVGFGYSHPL